MLARVSSRAPEGSAANRWHELDIHDLGDVSRLTILFRSVWMGAGERRDRRHDVPRRRYVEITTREELRAALDGYDPLADFEPHEDTRRRQQTATSITTAWEIACAELLGEASKWLD